MQSSPLRILDIPDNHPEIPRLQALFREYHQALGIDLTFQNMAQELADLPGKYSPSQRGRLYLALWKEAPAGCCGFYALTPETAELKRLYVRPSCQGHGIGEALLRRAILDAREMGYHQLMLDSLRRLTAARRLYDKIGFQETAPYNTNPYEDVYYMSLDLINL